MHKPSNGEISFFKLSLIIPYIFSRKAVSCCLNSNAGYLASTCRKSSSLLSARPLRNESPALWGDARSPYNPYKQSEDEEKGEGTIYMIREKEKIKTWDILPKREADAVLRRCGVKLAAPLALSVCWSSSNNVDEFDNQ